MPWVAEMTGYDPVAGIEKTALFAMGSGIAFTDAAYAPGALIEWESSSQRIDIGSEGAVKINADDGRIVLSNMPDSSIETGPLDAYAEWVWQNRRARLYWVPGRLWSQRIYTAHGIMEQPIASLAGSSTITFDLRDPRADLETPFQTSVYAGTNVGPTGLEGGPELKGRPRPILYGLVSNFSPVLVNESLLIYQLSDKPCQVLCVRDGGVSLSFGATQPDISSLQATNPSGGRYDVCHDSALGTFIRLGTKPVFNLTADADEATTEANQSHANMWARIRVNRIGSTINAASVTATHAADSAGAGFYWSETITQREALDEVLASFSGYEILSGEEWKIGKLLIPSGSPAIELLQMTPTARMKTISRAIAGEINKVRPSYAPRGAPPYRVSLNWGRNYTLMDKADFAGGANTRLVQKFGEEYRVAVAEDLSVWNPTLKTGSWQNAPEIVIKSGYQPGSGGLTSPGAEAEATRLMTLLGPMRPHYQVAFVPDIGDALEPGMVARLTYPRMGLETGPLFRVLQYRFSVRSNTASAGLVLGLQA